jgi:geranylgeranylglycerol-phosphate geranylgeranyltransferase
MFISIENLSRKIYGLFWFIRPEIIFLGVVCVYIGALVAGSESLSLKLILGMIAMLCMGAGCHPFNDYFDYEIDKINHPNRPLPSGVFKRITGLYLGLILFAISVVLSLLINIFCFAIMFIIIILTFIYEYYLKNKGVLGNFLVAFTVSIAFIYGGAIATDFLKPIFFSLVSFFVFFGREILLDVRDFEGDKKTRKTLPLIIGGKKSIIIGSALVITSGIILFIPFFYGLYSIWYGLMAIPLTIFTIYSLFISLLDLKNVGKTTELLRVSMIFGLVLFIIAIFT